MISFSHFDVTLSFFFACLFSHDADMPPFHSRKLLLSPAADGQVDYAFDFFDIFRIAEIDYLRH
jgi:hypothetical protein